MTRRDFFGLCTFFLLCGFVAAVSVLVTVPNVAGWYHGLHHPTFRPPDNLFAPIWTILYVLIAVSGWLVWSKVGFRAPVAMTLYGIQLVLNLAWPLLFFGGHHLGAALADSALLLAAIALTIAAFWRIEKIAAVLLVPYFLWVGFATALNAAIWRLN